MPTDNLDNRRRRLRRMFSRTDRLLVDHGVVRCPHRASDVDSDRCLGCQWVVEISDGVVECRPPSRTPDDWNYGRSFGA